MRSIRANDSSRAASILLLWSSISIFSCGAGTPPIPHPNSVASLEKVTLGGVEQWILIRGQDKTNPVLLFLHGGPGLTEMPTAHGFGDELEKHFVVVHWDQRGAGKSWHWNIPKESMNVNQFVSDTLELTGILQKRFGVQKIYLVGHSWGSLLGMLTVSKYPRLFYAYVGIGQTTDPGRAESISYQFTLDEARKRKDRKAIKALEKIKPPSYQGARGLITQRMYLTKFGGAIYRPTKSGDMAKLIFMAPEYTVVDSFKFFYGMYYSLDRMWPEVITYNLFQRVPRIEVPVYFFEGRHDYCVPGNLVEEYYQSLDAPKGKTLVWFDDSGHLPANEEPGKFNQAMVRVREETYNK